MYEQNRSKQKGFVALMTALIVSVSLLILVLAVGFESYYTRFSIFESDLKEKSIYLAEACVQEAILELSKDSGFSGGGSAKNLASGQCIIDAVTVSGTNERLIEVTASSSEAFTHLEVEVDISSAPDISITRWQEVI